MIVASCSGLISFSNPGFCPSMSFAKDRTPSVSSSLCIEITYFSLGQRSSAMAAASLRISSATKTAASDRVISSQISSAGRDTSKGTATLPLFTVPR